MGVKKKQTAFGAHDNSSRRFLLQRLALMCFKAPIRHFGFLANRAKKHALAQCRKLLKLDAALPEIPKKSAHDLYSNLRASISNRCPSCHQGTLIVVAELPPISKPVSMGFFMRKITNTLKPIYLFNLMSLRGCICRREKVVVKPALHRA